MNYLLIVNSRVGFRGNIGFRTKFIVQELHKRGHHVNLICRDSVNIEGDIKIRKFRCLSLFFRGLNFVHQKLPRFNHRPIELLILDLWTRIYVGLTYKNNMPHKVYLWDCLSRTTCFFNSKGVDIFLEFPYAPRSYGLRMQRKGLDFLLPSNMLWNIEKYCLEHSKCTIVPSSFVENELALAGINTTELIRFGQIEIEQLVRQDQGSAVRFIYLGNINKSKGIRDLLEVWSSLGLKNCELFLLGRMNTEIQRYLSTNRIKNVVAPGFVDFRDYLIDNSCFVFPSYSEGSSKSVGEALSFCLPVVASTASGSDIRHNYDGLLFDPGDKEMLSYYMVELYHSYELRSRLAENCFNRMPRSWQMYADEVVNKFTNE